MHQRNPSPTDPDAIALGIKVDTAWALVQQVDAGADRGRWTQYIGRAAAKPRGYDRLIKDINGCLEGSKILTYTPDGVPAFMEVTPKEE